MPDEQPDSLNTQLTEEIRKGGVGHNEVINAIVVMTPHGLQIAPEAPSQPDLSGPQPAADQPSTQSQQQE